jgi:WD40 repeat protein
MQWELIQSLEGHTGAIKSVTFSPDGKHIASGSDDKTIKIWQQDQSNKWECIETIANHTDAVNWVTFSRDGKFLASGSNDKTIRIWLNQKFKLISSK